MKFRLTLLACVLVAVLAFSAAKTLTFGSSTQQPSTTAMATNSTATRVSTLESVVRDRPTDVDALGELGSAYLVRARETGDPSYYSLAATCVQRASADAPSDVNVLIVSAGLALARHDFAGALALGEQARATAPDVTAVYGVLTDANVELGNYDDAVAAAQELADRKPGFASYTRVSYLRELNGDVAGAIEAMRQAADAGSGIAYDEAWARVLLGNLLLTEPDIDAAAHEYEHAAQILPGDPLTDFGLARLAIARGDTRAAEPLLRSAAERRPLPEYLIALGDLLWSEGRSAEADEQYALVRVTEKLFAANGVDVDIELALFDADQGTDPDDAFRRASEAYTRRGSVYGADVVAWAAYKAGMLDEAQQYSERALRLGTKDARLLYHAGVIAKARGDDEAASRYLRAAVSIEPAQSLRYAAAARAALAELTGSSAG